MSELEETYYQLPAVMNVPHRPEAEEDLLDWAKEMHSSIYDNYIPQTDRIENMNMVGETVTERPDAIGSRRFFYHRPNRTLYLDVRYGGEDFWDIVFSQDAAIVQLDTTNFDKILSDLDSDLQHAMDTVDDHIHAAEELTLDTTSFNNVLSSFDDEVQHAMDTIDDHTHDGMGLGEIEYIDFNLTTTSDHQEGRLHWHDDDGTLSLGMPGGNVELQIGQEMLVRCRNTTGSTILNGSPVYADGATGNRPLIKLADASTVAESYIIGMTTEDISNNANGYVATRGLVRDVNTGAYSVGETLWLSETPGQYTNIPPTAPAMKVFVGMVIASHASNGVIGVRPTVVQRMGFASDVLLATPSDGDFLRWVNANSRFEYDNPTITYKQLVSLATYVDVKERLSTWNLHGGFVTVVTGGVLNSTPTDLNFTTGRSKLMIVVNAGTDITGDILVTGTTADRDTGALTPADTETLTVDALTTDASDTDASGNVRHSFTGAYLTTKWFTGPITFSTTDLTLTDVDVYQVAFEQCNDEPIVEITTIDLSAFTTNTAAWLYGYLYLLEVTGDKCDLSRVAEADLPAAEVAADRVYRLRARNMGVTFNGTTDGFWLEVFPGPTANTYWEDVNLKVWFEVTKTTALN